MAFQLKDGQGSLFPNDRKTSDSHPDYKGSAMLNGQEFYLAAWTKKGARGEFLSLSIKPKAQSEVYQQAKKDIERQSWPTDHSFVDDDIPW
jgi:D-Tyr-tRNAtyr deacylase